MRFVTAPDLREYASDNHFRERLGAVTNRTYRQRSKLELPNYFVNLHLTAGALMEYAQNGRFRERLGAVTNRTYRQRSKLELPNYFVNLHLTAPTGNGAN